MFRACTCALSPSAYARNASSEGVVACPKGVSSFLILTRSSPSLPLMAAAALPSASSTCSLSGACACALTISSPVAVFCAVSVITYSLPRFAIVPVRIALSPSRSPISLAIAGVNCVSVVLPRYFMLCNRCCWLTILMTGDCSRSICSAWFSVVSKTGSPVWLTKSARMRESLADLGAPATPLSWPPVAVVPSVPPLPAAVPSAAGATPGLAPCLYFHHASPAPMSSNNSSAATEGRSHFFPLLFCIPSDWLG